MSDIFTTTKPWPGVIPPICVFEHLPAFPDEAALYRYNARCGGASIVEKWLCAVCRHWHYIAKPPAPSGASSGTTRSWRQPVPRYRRERRLIQPVGDEF